MAALSESEALDLFEGLVESVQHRLRGFVFSLTGSQHDAEDIVQETNRVLWRKREQFEVGTNFWAWASKIAYFQVMAYRKRRSRDRLVFSEEFTHTLADEMSLVEEGESPAQQSLQKCISKLPDRQRLAIENVYLKGTPAAHVATELGLNENALSQLLFRARKNLQRCLSRASAEKRS